MKTNASGMVSTGADAGVGRQEIYAEQLAAIPEFASLGALFKSSDSVELTEAETEYVVQCVKHTFLNHIVLQFNCTNTLQDQVIIALISQDFEIPLCRGGYFCVL